ncbi:MAG TPA: hypothetical protein V6C96_04555 [Vampirovibrionales bacterium]
MTNKYKNFFNKISYYSSELNVDFFPQDWGLINGDAYRVQEFIDYYNKSNIEEGMKHDFFDLILSSFNEFLSQQINDQEVEKQFVKFVEDNKNEEAFLFSFNYWKRLTDKEEFPISSFLKQIS